MQLNAFKVSKFSQKYLSKYCWSCVRLQEVFYKVWLIYALELMVPNDTLF
jgi:hypothetical protein